MCNCIFKHSNAYTHARMYLYIFPNKYMLYMHTYIENNKLRNYNEKSILNKNKRLTATQHTHIHMYSVGVRVVTACLRIYSHLQFKRLSHTHTLVWVYACVLKRFGILAQHNLFIWRICVYTVIDCHGQYAH